MEELIDAGQVETLIVVGSLVLAVIGAIWGYFAVGRRGVLLMLCGPLVWIMWQGHKWLTRYDPQSGYFGLNKVGVLAVEVMIFLALGIALGWMWSKFISRRGAENAE